MKTVLPVSDLSEMLGVSTDSVYAMVREKQIPHVRVKRRILFHREAIDEWLKRGSSFKGLLFCWDLIGLIYLYDKVRSMMFFGLHGIMIGCFF